MTSDVGSLLVSNNFILNECDVNFDKNCTLEFIVNLKTGGEYIFSVFKRIVLMKIKIEKKSKKKCHYAVTYPACH